MLKNSTYCVYLHTAPNGKMYIGQSIYGDNINRRWQNGNGYKKQPRFYRAIQKYGWDNFEHEILASRLTHEEANNFEQLLIKELDLRNPNKGYNDCDGGSYSNGMKDKHHSEATIAKLSKRFSGENNPMFGISPQERMTAEKFEEWREANRQAQLKVNRKSGNNPSARKCVRLFDLKIYDCLVDAAKELGISKTSMCRYCKKGSDYMYLDEYILKHGA